ncbi:aspartate/glutamate racemase family protein [Candidatus Nomurabacteria bacterium]|nr:aspartate/glutamate racemase family protein [Candidatus Nomurabacteria bacterium]
MKKTIGILGGIGPESSAWLYGHLIKMCRERQLIRNNADYPHIVINSIPAPDLITGKITKETLWPYKEGIALLERAGVDFIAIACNTAHVFFDELQSTTSINILDLRQEVKKKILDIEKRILILSTQTSYDNSLYSYPEANCIVPSSEDREAISDCIKKYVIGTTPQQQSKKVRDIIEKYVDKEDILLTGCTELSLMLKDCPYVIIDPLELLAQAILRLWQTQ